MVDLGDSPVEGYDFEAVVCSIHDQVLAHNGQTDEAEVTTGIETRRSADIDAGETGATVSQCIYQQRSELMASKQGRVCKL